MTTTRPYRKALDVREALVRLGDAAGTQLDETLVATFIDGIEHDVDPPLPDRCWGVVGGRTPSSGRLMRRRVVALGAAVIVVTSSGAAAQPVAGRPPAGGGQRQLQRGPRAAVRTVAAPGVLGNDLQLGWQASRPSSCTASATGACI